MKEISIFDYVDYRRFLNDAIRLRLARNSRLSFRAVAKRAGFASPGYCQMVIRGERNLSANSAAKFADYFRMDPEATAYLKSLVSLNQARSELERRKVLSEMQLCLQQVRPAVPSKVFAIEQTWDGLAILELGYCRDFVLTPESAYEALNKVVPLPQLRLTFDFLTLHGYLRREGGSFCVVESPMLRSRDEIQSAFVEEIHRQASHAAQRALELPVAEREFQNVTLALSEGNFAELKRRIKQLALDLTETFANDANASEVYQINLQAFPVTRTQSKKIKHNAL